MHLLLYLWFFSAYFGFTIVACHIPGALNTVTDQLSRNRSAESLKLNAHVSIIPEVIPMSLLKLISPQKLDWTPPSF